MGFPRSNAALKDLETLFAGGTIGPLADSDLLERFVASRDEAAFEALVKRHGPMVLQNGMSSIWRQRSMRSSRGCR
jgi:hypothetical protein